MIEKRFEYIIKDFWDNVADEPLSFKEIEERINELYDANEQLKSENKKYKHMFFEIVETTLSDKTCRKLFCGGLLDIFDKANSLNQARDMVKEHLK